MKRKYQLFVLLSLFNFSFVFAENLKTIHISEDFASYIYFPEVLKAAELGVPEDIDATIENKTLKITALQPFNYPTNLTVYTKSGGIYAFFIKYSKKPQSLYNYISEKEILKKGNSNNLSNVKSSKKELNAIKALQKKEKEIFEKAQKIQEEKVLNNCKKILSNFQNGSPIGGDRKGKMLFYLYPTLAKNNYLYFVLFFKNFSKIDYKVEDIFTHIGNKKRHIKRSALTTNRINPYLRYEEGKKGVIKANGGEHIIILAFQKFTFDDDKFLFWEIYESGGERNFKTRINSKQFYNANNF